MPATGTAILNTRSPKGDSTVADTVVRLIRRGATQMPSPASSIAALTIFALLAASLGLAAVWWFIRRGGFEWREGDWEDYVSSVMRRPGNPDSDILTVFSDGSCRRGGAGSRGTRTIVLSDYDGLSRAEKSVISGVSRSGVGGWKGLVTRLRGGDWESEMNESEYERRYAGRARKQRGQEKHVYFDARPAGYADDTHSIATQEPARVPGWKPEDSMPPKSDLDRSRTTKSYYLGDDSTADLGRSGTNRSYYPGDDRPHRSDTNRSYYPGDDRPHRSGTNRSYYPGDDRPNQKQSTAYRPSRHSTVSGSTETTDRRPTKGKTLRTISSMSTLSSDSSSSSEYETDTDEEDYGTKVYSHKLEKRAALDLWDNQNKPGSSHGYRSDRRGSLSTLGSNAK